MPTTIEVYSLAELKEKFPSAYESVHERWKRVASDDVPWQSELLDSLKAVVRACGATLRDYSIGTGGPNSVKVSGVDDDEQTKAWFLKNVLKPNGYTKKNGHATFPGVCAFTGYCADDDLLESVWKDLCDGCTMTEALQNLSTVTLRISEYYLEQQCNEESMMDNWGDNNYTENGTEV